MTAATAFPPVLLKLDPADYNRWIAEAQFRCAVSAKEAAP
jgi:hypothetical protein